MGDISDNLTNDTELLDILLGSDTNIDTSGSGTTGSDDDEANKKLEELHEIATQLSLSNQSGNKGSGDLDIDLSNWFDGRDNLPSNDLNNYVSNANVKMEYGLQRNVLSSYSLMGKLHKFIEHDAFDALFSEQAILGLDNDELESRIKTAFIMYKDLATLNAKVIHDLKDYQLKSNTDNSDIDKLSLLLGSIPTNKLQSILEEISMGKK